ncbi:LuxR C-terminal-related transcriptional regulator [Corynebacterium sp. YIM 101645]|uniref:LuxR C-terminal-related transcriptional regulator n=1 Tax=Corynebacterium lemuris TaxID=1859292 RepID=A0ABT2FYB7_9CORY|nr:LuxR family transcriptional regulator [Corynebacterium lemuris]MCS5480238.1 LuxR C-terminal-related transcriptional regulator [Corynebacterium lemuris]
MGSQYLRHVLRRLLSQAVLRVSAGEAGSVLLITGPEGAGRRQALDAVAARLAGHGQVRVPLFRWDRKTPGALRGQLPSPLADVLVLVDDLHFADEASLRELITTARRPDSTVSVIATVDGEELNQLATDVLVLPPLSLAETAGYLESLTGRRIPVATVEQVHAQTGGWPGQIEKIVVSVPEGELARRGAQERSEHENLDRALELTADFELPTAELYLNECRRLVNPAEQDSLRGYLALNRGLRRRAHQFLAHPGPDPRHRARGVLLALVDWDLPDVQAKVAALRAGAPASPATTEARVLGLVADAAESGRMPDSDFAVDSVLNRQRLDMVQGWLALTFDDPLTAREKLQHFGDQSPAVGLWQDAWLARTLYVLGEWSAAARTVERGLAAAEARGMHLLEPMLLWTGVQIAAMQGDQLLARNYLQRLTLDEDAFLLQSLPAAMGRMIVAANSADLPTALRAGEQLARTVASADTQHPGFWPWEDVYAQTLIRAGRIDRADEVITGAEERQGSSGLVSVIAKNAVPRATIQIQRGDVVAGLRTFESAVESISDTPMPAYQSRILFEYGKVLRRQGRRQRADEVLSHAAEIYAQMEATVMVELCAAERRIGGVGTPQHLNPHGLTPQEEQIAVRVTEGATNAEVARELSLSTKTVEYHLTRVYRKLGVRSRQGLREVLGRG